MNKKLIRLTESDLHRIVKESVEKILNEVKWTDEFGKEYADQHGDDEKAWERLIGQRKRGMYNNYLEDEGFSPIDTAIARQKSKAAYYRNRANICRPFRGNLSDVSHPSYGNKEDNLKASKGEIELLNRLKPHRDYLNNEWGYNKQTK